MILTRQRKGIFLPFMYLLTCFFFFSACGSDFKKKAKESIKDSKVTTDEWGDLVGLAKIEKKYCRLFFDNDVLIHQNLRTFLEEYYSENIRGGKELVFDMPLLGSSISSNAQEPIKIKFFLERSGSMTPFDSPQANGEFKSAIITLLNSLPQEQNNTNLIFVVNNAVYPYDKSFKEFILSKDIFKDTQMIGDPRYTDFSCIFDSILTRTQGNELSILVSDMIYSTKEMSEVNPQKIFNEAQAITTSVFNGHTDKDVLILKLVSSYVGNYYPFNSPSKGVAYKGNRPYYILMVGEKEVVKRLFFDDKYKEFAHFKRLKGFEGFYCFSKKTATDEPYFSILLTGSRNRGRFSATKGSGTVIHDIERTEPDRNNELALTLAVDMSGIVAEEACKLNKENYVVTSLSNFILEDVIEISNETMTPAIKRYAPKATHLLLLKTTDKLQNEPVKVMFTNKLPNWMEESNTDDDRSLQSPDFSNTTFAFKYLMNGIYESYYSTLETPAYFSITINIKK